MRALSIFESLGESFGGGEKYGGEV